MRLAYLADIFGKLNELNASLQGKNINPFIVMDKVNAMVKKLQFILSDLDQSRLTSLSSLESFLTENELKLSVTLIEDIKEHLSQLISDLYLYFPEQFGDKEWIRNSFSDVVSPADLSVQERDQFIELSCDGGLKNEFKKDIFCDF
ncbi:MAG: hypothetical protein ACHQLA_08770 [Ignavibacteriales bacterium]